MKISVFNRFYKNSIELSSKMLNNSSLFSVNASKLKPLQADVVSFKAKNYDFSMIKSPTGHCAYCGSKVYTQKQIDTIAGELLSQKNEMLAGKIRSVLEKMGSSDGNVLIKRKYDVNKDAIDFFERFKDLSAIQKNKSGYEILTGMLADENISSKEQMLKFLSVKLQPLLKTIDHVTPQHEELNNDNIDLNLVESCHTCNVKLKNGSSFQSFYYTYPTIKDSMPKEKFEFASLGLLENASDLVVDKISSEELFKVIDELFEQKYSTLTLLHSLEEKIRNCKQNVLNIIDKVTIEKNAKLQEKEDLKLQFSAHEQDEEFLILKQRKELNENFVVLQQKANELNDEHLRLKRNISAYENKIREIEKSVNKSKKNRNNYQNDGLTVKDYKQKIFEAQAASRNVLAKVSDINDKISAVQRQLYELAKKCPEIDTLKNQKSGLEKLLKNYNSLNSLNKKLVENNLSLQTLEDKKLKNAQELAKISNNTTISPEEFNKLKTVEQSLAKSINSVLKDRENLKSQSIVLVNEIEKFLNQDEIFAKTKKTKNFHKDDEFSLSELNSKIVEKQKSRQDCINQFLKFQKNKSIENQVTETDNNFYSELKKRFEILQKECVEFVPRFTFEEIQKQIDDLENEFKSFYDKDFNDSFKQNRREYQYLLENLEYIKDGFESVSYSPKEIREQNEQINALNEQIQQVADRDFIIFNQINDVNNFKVMKNLAKINEELTNFKLQYSKLEEKLKKSENILGEVSQNQVQEKIKELDFVIKRLSEKAHWLDIPEKIRYIDAELKIEDDNILELKRKLAEIEKSESEA